MASPSSNIGWILKQNKRYASLLDTVLKLGTIIVAFGTALSVPVTLLINSFLGQLNQSPLPVAQSGHWIFVLLFSIAVTVLFALIVLMPAAMTMSVRLNAPGLPVARVKRACSATALVTTAVMVGILIYNDSWISGALFCATIGGGLAGAWAATGVASIDSRFFSAFAGFGSMAFLLIVWIASLFLLLAPMAGSFTVEWPVLSAAGLILLLLAMLGVSIIKPVVGIFMGLALTIGWTAQQASPDGGVLIAGALYAANLGGGRPAAVDQPRDVGEICNLGVAERPVLFFEAEGCGRAAAFKRIRALSGKNSLERRRIIGKWQRMVERSRSGRSAAGLAGDPGQ